MEPLDDAWVEELLTQIKQSVPYYQLDEQMAKLRYPYETLRQSLSRQERELLDAYQSLRSRMEVCMTRTAYIIGLEHGRNRK